MMATAIELAQADLPEKIEAVRVHGEGSSLSNDLSLRICSNYQIHGFPTALVDCSTYVENYESSYTASLIVNAIRNTEDTYDTCTGTMWTSSVSGNEISLNLTAYIKTSGSYKVTALLIEDDIVAYQSGYGYDYVHTAVLRGAFTDAMGDEFYTNKSCSVRSFDYSMTIPAECNLNNLRILVYIQRNNGGVYYVDNAASEDAGHAHALEIDQDGVIGEVEGIVPGDDIIL